MLVLDLLKLITDEKNITIGNYGIFLEDALLKSDIARLIECEDFECIQSGGPNTLYINTK